LITDWIVIEFLIIFQYSNSLDLLMCSLEFDVTGRLKAARDPDPNFLETDFDTFRFAIDRLQPHSKQAIPPIRILSMQSMLLAFSNPAHA
jgi:hypothetical protein